MSEKKDMLEIRRKKTLVMDLFESADAAMDVVRASEHHRAKFIISDEEGREPCLHGKVPAYGKWLQNLRKTKPYGWLLHRLGLYIKDSNELARRDGLWLSEKKNVTNAEEWLKKDYHPTHQYRNTAFGLGSAVLGMPDVISSSTEQLNANGMPLHIHTPSYTETLRVHMNKSLVSVPFKDRRVSADTGSRPIAFIVVRILHNLGLVVHPQERWLQRDGMFCDSCTLFGYERLSRHKHPTLGALCKGCAQDVALTMGVHARRVLGEFQPPLPSPLPKLQPNLDNPALSRTEVSRLTGIPVDQLSIDDVVGTGTGDE